MSDQTPSPVGSDAVLGTAERPAVSGMSFEAALAELELIVRGLERGDAALEDAITAYTRGTALRAHCERKLTEAEQRVQSIVPPAAGGVPALSEAG